MNAQSQDDVRKSGGRLPLDVFNDRPVNRVALGLIIFTWTVIGVFYFLSIFSNANLMDHYAFRQTQVATVIRELQEGGPWLAYRMPVLGPPWTAPMEFPLYQLTVAGISHLTGLSLETVGRLLSLVSGAACLLLTWRMAQLLGLSRRLQLLIVLMLALSPMFTYWSETVMIETFALALCLGISVCAAEFLENKRRWPLLIGGLLGIAAALTKVTTFVPFSIGLFIYFGFRLLGVLREDWGAWSKHFGLALRWIAAGCVLLLPGLVLTLLWVHWSDGLKAQSEMTAFLTSENLTRWNYGEIGDFFQSMSYLVTSFRGGEGPSLFEQSFGAYWMVLVGLALAGLVIASRHRVLALGLALACISGPLIFKNLYEVHFYYWVATITFSVAVLALGIDGFIDLAGSAAKRLKTGYSSYGAGLAACLIGALALLGSQQTLHGFFLAPAKHPSQTIPTVAEVIRQNVPEGGVVFGFGYNWNPAIQYYADRPMVMARNEEKIAIAWGLKQGLSPAAAAFCGAKRSMAEEILQYPLFARDGGWKAVNKRDYCIIYVPENG